MNNIIERVWNQGSMVTIEDLSGAAFQAESGGHTFRIRGVDKDGNALTLSGTPSGVMLRADGQDVTLTCSVSSGVVTATLPANAYSVPGRFGITIFLTSDSQKTALYAAIGSVVKTSSGTVAPPAGSDVVDLINQINTAIAAIPVNYNASFAPAYSISGLYSVGQYVTYDGNLYRCISAISSGESWTSSHWTQVALANEVGDLKSALNFDEYLINNGEYTIKASDLEYGAWSYHIKTESTIRARTKYLLPVRAGMIISYSNTTFDTYFGVLETPTSNSYIQTIGWKTDGSGTVNITKDGYLTFVIRNHMDTSATIDLSNYNSNVVISTKNRNELDGLGSIINNLEPLTYEIDGKLKIAFKMEKSAKTNMSSLTLAEGKYWGNNGKKSAQSDYGTYYAADTLISVDPGSIVVLNDFGHSIDSNEKAIIGLYDENGYAAPGRVNLGDALVIHVNQDNDTLNYAFILIPEECKKIGLFYISKQGTIPNYQIISLRDMSNSLKEKVKIFINEYTSKRFEKIGDFEEAQYVDFNSSQTVDNKYWGDTGLKSSSNYRALTDLIAVNAGEYVYLKNFGSFGNITNAAIGMYDNDGVGSPGRVDFDSEYVESLDITGDVVNSAKILVPEGCTQVGLFYKTTNFSGTPKFKIGDMKLELSSDFEALIQAMIIEILSHIDVNTKNLEADYYILGASNKLPRTKKLCILGAGQSNIDGRNFASTLPSGVSLPMTGMKYIKNSMSGVFENAFSSEKWGFDLIVCHELINNLGADNLYYIKWSQGGTSIDLTGDGAHWTPDYDTISPSENALLYQFNLEVNKCAEENADEYEIGAMIWHQGEGDRASASPTAAANYYSNFKKLIAYCRGMAKNPKLPFICGTISHNSGQYDATVDAAIRRIAAEDAHVYLVDMANAALRDQYHFDATWSEYFGKKVYDCLIDAKVITGTKINPSEPT